MADQMDEAKAGPGRALVPLRAGPAPRFERPMAGFVTQLIACHQRLPAYRQARRAEPEIAAARYGASLARLAVTFDSDA